MALLDKIRGPEDLKALSIKELEILCGEIRQLIIRTVGCNGGHLASNLGVVELTVALHYVLHLPEDKIVWDVGHQAYTHKILTGRKDQIQSIRKKDGLSGFPKPQESPYDAFAVGHASTSISAALGLARAAQMQNRDDKVVAVIGDGALTGGLAYEGLNNAGRLQRNLIVILNDNGMSISPNVGNMARYLAYIRAGRPYLNAKGRVEKILSHIPAIGEPLQNGLKHVKKKVKSLIYNSTIFEDLGFLYYGPFDGHDLPGLIHILQTVSTLSRPVLLHLHTSKGKGYTFAEDDPDTFHGVSAFDVKTGLVEGGKGESFSDVFGRSICQFAQRDSRVCAITAAMQLGTCLTDFRQRFPARFFDVGIAEEHAITFAGGLASGGMIPVCAIYSTFLQRGYDQIIHDAAIQRVKLVLAIDRAGVVGEDGETHQGVFDAAFLHSIPDVTIFAPAYYDELHECLRAALFEVKGVCAVRYPRGKSLYRPVDYHFECKPFSLYGDVHSKIRIVTYGRLFSFTAKARENLRKQGLDVCIIKLNCVKPIAEEAYEQALQGDSLYFFEEGIEAGGIGEHFLSQLTQRGYRGKTFLRGIGDFFLRHASMQEQLQELQLDDVGIYRAVMEGEGRELKND